MEKKAEDLIVGSVSTTVPENIFTGIVNKDRELIEEL